MVATGTEPKVASSSGSAPAWAASVTESSSRTVAGPGSDGAEAGPEQQDARRRRGRQPEPDGSGQQGIHQDQPRDGEAEHADACRRAAERRRRGGDARHRRGPHDGRLEADQQAEEGDRRQRHRQPERPPKAAEQRTEQHQHEGDVLARHGLEVGQTGSAEVVGHLGGLGAVVAEHDAEQQRACAVRQVGGAALEGSAQPVGRLADRGTILPGAHLVDGEAAHDPPGDEPVPPRPERRRGPD